MILKIGIIDLVVIISIFQLAVFIFFLLLKKNRHQTNLLLAVFLVSQLLILVNGLTRNLANNYQIQYQHLFFPGMAFLTLVAPVLYFYVRSLAYSDFTLAPKHSVHLIPFIIALSFFIGAFIVQFQHTLPVYPYTHTILSIKFYFYYCIAYYIQILVYNTASLLVLTDYQAKIKQQYSSLNRINLSWLRIVIYGYIVSWLMDVVQFLTTFQIIHLSVNLKLPVMISFFTFFNIIFFKGLTQPQIFSITGSKIKYQSSPLTSSQAIDYKNVLNNYMLKNKPFLNPDITLKELAEECDIPPRYLSQIINEYYQQNFYDFISKYRIDEFKNIMQQSRNNRKTVLEIMYEAGFNSKSAFHLSFKKYTGMTPNQFKKSLAH